MGDEVHLDPLRELGRLQTNRPHNEVNPLVSREGIPALGVTLPHKEAVSLFERYANGGDNPKLRDWADRTLAALKHHLEMAQNMAKTESNGRDQPCVNRGACPVGRP
jgi:hypothetical protein